MHIGRHKYASLRTIFDFMTELKLKKNQIQFLEHREILVTSFGKTKLKIFFFSPVTVWYRKKSLLTVCFHSTVKEFFFVNLDLKIAVKMNLRIKTKNNAADPESFSQNRFKSRMAAQRPCRQRGSYGRIVQLSW